MFCRVYLISILGGWDYVLLLFILRTPDTVPGKLQRVKDVGCLVDTMIIKPTVPLKLPKGMLACWWKKKSLSICLSNSIQTGHMSGAMLASKCGWLGRFRGVSEAQRKLLLRAVGEYLGGEPGLEPAVPTTLYSSHWSHSNSKVACDYTSSNMLVWAGWGVGRTIQGQRGAYWERRWSSLCKDKKSYLSWMCSRRGRAMRFLAPKGIDLWY